MVQPGITDGSGETVTAPGDTDGDSGGSDGGSDTDTSSIGGGGATGGGLDPGGGGGTGDDTGGSGDIDPTQDDFDTTDEATGGSGGSTGGGGATGGGLDPGGAGGTGDDTGGSGDPDPTQDDFGTTEEAMGGSEPPTSPLQEGGGAPRGEPTSAGGQLTTDGRIDAGLDTTRGQLQGGQGADPTPSGGVRPADRNLYDAATATSEPLPADRNLYAESDRLTGERAGAREAAEEFVDTTLEEGLEGPAGQSFAVGGRSMDVRDEARDFEEEIIATEPWAEGPDDVAIRFDEATGEFVAEPSRSATVEGYEERLTDVAGDAAAQTPSAVGAEDVAFEETPEGGIGVSIDGGAIETAQQDARDADPGGQPPEPPSLTEWASDVAGETREQGLGEAVERGGALSEAARDVTAVGLGLGFQDPEEVGSAVGISEQRIERFDTEVSGPGLEAVGEETGGVTLFDFDPGEPGALDPEIAGDLSAGRGLFTDEQVAGRRAAAEDIREAGDFGDVTRGAAETFGLGGGAADFAEGLGQAPGSLASVPLEATVAADAAVEAGANLPGAVEEYGAPAVGQTVLETGGRAVSGLYQQAEANPARFAGQLAGEAAGATAALRGVERGASAARGARQRQQADVVVDLEDVTSEQAVAGELPEFETSPGAPTREAVGEVRERAADQPAALTEQDDLTESLLFRSESDPLEGDVDVGRGQYELPGMFASPDLSPLRLEDIGGSSGLSLPSFRFTPRLRGGDDQVTVFPGDEIEGMPASATGARRVPDPEGEGAIPDPETGGAQFLDEAAEPGTAYVRPTGSRSTELEAIFPPGSQFVEGDVDVAVNLPGGRTVPGTTFQRAGGTDVDAPEADVRGAGELPETRVSTRPPGADETTVGPPVFGGAGTTAPVGETTGTTALDDVFGTAPATEPVSDMDTSTAFETEPATTVGTEPTGTTALDDVFGTQPTEPPTGPPSGGPTGVSEPPTTPPTEPPTGPPTGPPTEPPTGPPTEPPTSPPLGPPTAPPTTPGARPWVGRGDDPDEPERDERDRGPLTPEYTNPILSGFEDILEAGDNWRGDGWF